MHVEQRRGGLLETVHPVSAALYVDGAIRWSVGPDTASFWRSGCKALQLTSSLSHLPAELVAGLSDADLSIGAASHSGQPMHTEHVARLLERFDLVEADLRCGAHRPMHEPSARKLDQGPSRCRRAAGWPCAGNDL